MAVWNIGMYSKSITESSKSVLIEVLRILGSYRDYLVLTGGWAPYFILEKFGGGGQHCGSIDIDKLSGICDVPNQTDVRSSCLLEFSSTMVFKFQNHSQLVLGIITLALSL